MKSKRQLEATYLNTRLLVSLLGVIFAVILGFVLVFLLDTGSLVESLAKHKQTKLDEVVFCGIALLAAIGILSAHKWAGFSRLVVRYEQLPTSASLPELRRVRTAQQRDAMYVVLALVSAVIFVHFFDTGVLAEWLARHKDSKVDEAIVTGVVLLAGLSFFSIRRLLELTDHVLRYEDLHRRTTNLNHEMTLLGELSESLQSCLSADVGLKLQSLTAA